MLIFFVQIKFDNCRQQQSLIDRAKEKYISTNEFGLMCTIPRAALAHSVEVASLGKSEGQGVKQGWSLVSEKKNNNYPSKRAKAYVKSFWDIGQLNFYGNFKFKF